MLPTDPQLYDLTLDPEENWNLAGSVEWQQVREKLSQQLHAGWREALPQ